MRASMRSILLFMLFAFPARAFADGMYLCHTPVSAFNLWSDVVKAQQAGVHLTPEILENIAAKNECPMVSADSFTPKNFVANQLLLTNGIESGWASPYYYILFANRKGP